MVLEKFRLDGQIALVTGGTRGIGLAIARGLGEAGARLIISSRKPKPEAVDELKAAGFQVDYIAADLEQPEAPKQLIDAALRVTGRLDILVNNAGVAAHGDTEGFSQETYRKVMATNLDSLFYICQAALTPMRKQKSGVILNIGSISGIVSNIPQRQAAYNSSKAAVHMLTRSLASDYADEGIRVNAIAPGYITTDMTNDGLADPEMGPIWNQLTPLGRPGDANEIAGAALFLCSPASSYVTGEVLVIDGGYTLR